MSDFIEAQVADIDRRLEEIDRLLGGRDALVREREQLVALRVALVGQESDRPPAGQRKAGRRRARRGEAREKVLAAVGERPGVGHAELAAVAGLDRSYLYNLVRRLVDAGEIERVELPGGATGYRRRDAVADAEPASESRSSAEDGGAAADGDGETGAPAP